MILKSLLIFVPISIVLRWVDANPLWTFLAAAVAIVPLADQLAQATEKVAGYLGSTIGGLLNASLGNAPEIIIGAFALKNGLQDVVKASITGSILMNLLVSPGVAMLLGGWKRERQKFNPNASRMTAALMMLAAIGLIVPSVFVHTKDPSPGEKTLSFEIACVLFLLYILSMVFTLVTHRHLFSSEEEGGEGHGGGKGGLGKSLAVLLLIAVVLAVVSEVLTDALDPATQALGLSDVFAGVIVVGVLGNVAELFAAARFARSDNMDLVIGSTLGAAQQVALVVAPVLLFLSYAFEPAMQLVFTPFEVVALTLSVFVVGQLTRDGESNWMEGAMLLAVYLMFALGFYFLPEAVPPTP